MTSRMNMWNRPSTKNVGSSNSRVTMSDDPQYDDSWNSQSDRNDGPWNSKNNEVDDPLKIRNIWDSDSWNSGKDYSWSTGKDYSRNSRKDDCWNSRKDDSWNSRKDDSLFSRRDDSFSRRDDSLFSLRDDSLFSLRNDSLYSRTDDSLNSGKDGSWNSRKDGSWNSRNDGSWNSRKIDSWNSQKDDSWNSQKDDSWNAKNDRSWNSPNGYEGSWNYSSREDNIWNYSSRDDNIWNYRNRIGDASWNSRDIGRSRFSDAASGGYVNPREDTPYYRAWVRRNLKREQAKQDPPVPPMKYIVQKAWWTEKCQKAHDDFKELKKKFSKQRPTKENTVAFKIAKYQYRQVLRNAKFLYAKEMEGEEPKEDDKDKKIDAEVSDSD